MKLRKIGNLSKCRGRGGKHLTPTPLLKARGRKLVSDCLTAGSQDCKTFCQIIEFAKTKKTFTFAFPVP